MLILRKMFSGKEDVCDTENAINQLRDFTTRFQKAIVEQGKPFPRNAFARRDRFA